MELSTVQPRSASNAVTAQRDGLREGIAAGRSAQSFSDVVEMFIDGPAKQVHNTLLLWAYCQSLRERSQNAADLLPQHVVELKLFLVEVVSRTTNSAVASGWAITSDAYFAKNIVLNHFERRLGRQDAIFCDAVEVSLGDCPDDLSTLIAEGCQLPTC